MKVNAARLKADLERLAEFGRQPTGAISRTALSEADIQARRWYAEQASAAGLSVHTDAVGNVTAACGNGGEPAVWTGSHLDSVPEGGAFDGALGAMVALECVRCLHEQGVSLQRPVVAVAFSDEEGTFFGYLGSKALAGMLDPQALADVTDQHGTTLPDALRRLGTDLSEVPGCALPDGAVHSFIELHIEQGPVLESIGAAIGSVTHIVGVRRGRYRFDGRPDHAGTTPMHLRQDPVRAAAAFLDQLVEVPARAGRPDAVVTCGRVDLRPGAHNVVPAVAEVSLDFRDTSVDGLDLLEERLDRAAHASAARHNVAVSVERESTTDPVDLDPDLCDAISLAAKRRDLTAHRMPSGAGHDAQVMAQIAPVGMLFVPSQDGRSHSRWEQTAWPDIEHGANVLLDTLVAVAGSDEGGSRV